MGNQAGEPVFGVAAAHRERRVAHWDGIARRIRDRGGAIWARFYHQELVREYRHVVSPGMRVLEVGSGTGDLLASLEPSLGVGIDLSPEMVALAQERHPRLTFVCADAALAEVSGPFDVIILSDLVNDLYDVQAVLERVRGWCEPGTRVLLNVHSQLWRPILSSARALGLAMPQLAQNWLTVADTAHLLFLTDHEVLRSWQSLLCPFRLPLLARFCNRYVARLWPFRHLCLTNLVLARPAADPAAMPALPTVSVIVPARNEAGTIGEILDRVPQMGGGTEILFVEGGSSDDTAAVIETEIRNRGLGQRCRLLRQSGKGKGDAVRLGFSQASGDILMILDADLTVPPETLPRFYAALQSGRAECANGVRLVYPLADEAMRFFNLLGNKFFSLAFTWLLGQPVKDTLCGTKVLWRKDYERIAANRAWFGHSDPFGDFDLLFGAVRQNLRIVDIPVRYGQRTYGNTNISRWRHGMLLLRMLLLAARRIKFL